MRSVHALGLRLCAPRRPLRTQRTATAPPAPGVSGAEAVPAPLSARSEPCEDKDSVTSRKCALAYATGAPYAPLTPGASARPGLFGSATVVGPEGLARGNGQAIDPARAAHRINEGTATNEGSAQLCDARPPSPAPPLRTAGGHGGRISSSPRVLEPGGLARVRSSSGGFVRGLRPVGVAGHQCPESSTGSSACPSRSIASFSAGPGLTTPLIRATSTQFALRRLMPAADLLNVAGRGPLVQQRRPQKVAVQTGAGEVWLCDQAPLHEGHIEWAIGFAMPDLVALLNRHVFFWPGTEHGPMRSGRNHLRRYEAADPVVMRVPTAALLATTGVPHPLFSQVNSGAPPHQRWSSFTQRSTAVHGIRPVPAFGGRSGRSGVQRQSADTQRHAVQTSGITRVVDDVLRERGSHDGEDQ